MNAKSKLADATATQDTDLVAAARELARARLGGVARSDGQDAFEHAHAVAAMLRHAGAPPALEAAAYLVDIGRGDAQTSSLINATFGASIASLVDGALRLEALEDTARAAGEGASTSVAGVRAGTGSPQVASTAAGGGPAEARPWGRPEARTERLRRMLLAFSRDLRGVLLHLASRLQVMRWHAQRGTAYPAPLAREAMELLAPLASRLGAWSLKWELEDLAFRSLEPQAYLDLERKLDATRDARLREVERFRDQVTELLARAGISAQVQGRAKHLASIWKKMQGKHLDFEHVLDVRALRVVVASVADCYAALSRLQARWPSVQGEFDDYIARPKPNGYQSLHTVLLDEGGRAVEVQIRTQAMHDHAEHGVAAHWAYKEAGPRGYAGASPAADDAKRVQGARKAMLHQLLAWERDVTSGDDAQAPPDRVYVFTPQGAVVDLPAGSTAIDFAYAVHTSLGHRCRGAKVDGVLVPLVTPLVNGQTIEVTAVKEGGPSLDWLNAELHYLASPRSKAKVRAWFNAQALETTEAQGRDRLERLLQRLGRTAVKHAEIAARLNQPDAQALYAALGKDDITLRDVEHLWQAQASAPEDEDAIIARRIAHAPARGEASQGHGDVLVVGVDSLLTGLARCCRPAPPDAIGGFVTRHKGVAIHRRSCTNFRHMAERSPQRVIAVDWSASPTRTARFAVDLAIEAADRPGLLRDITEVLAKEKLNVVGAHTQTLHDARGTFAHMLFTVEVASTDALDRVLAQVAKVAGVRAARRR